MYLAIAVGFVLLFIPGLIIAFFLSPMLYLVATEQSTIFGSFSKSFQWTKKHAGAVGALWVGLIGGNLLLFGVVLCLNFIPIIGPLLGLPIQIGANIFFLVLFVSTMLNLDAAENGWRLGMTHDGIEQVFE